MDTVVYKGVVIHNLRNARNGSNRVMIRNISVRYLADKWGPDGDSFWGEANIKRAYAVIDWLLANGSRVEDGHIVATHTNFDFCLHGCQVRNIEGYWKFMKGGK
jgi:hypothetical protein